MMKFISKTNPASTRYFFLLLLVICTKAVAQDGDIGRIDKQGERLLQVLELSQVEQLWLPGLHVKWESGEADGKPLKGNGKHTHCSAFAAAIAKRLGIYLLRPPEHSATLLANAQYDWLKSEGKTVGWDQLTDSKEAQALANRGSFVVAVYRNHHDDRPGHIAIIRPDQKTVQSVIEEGPQITQAGATNYLSTTLKQGFVSHPAAWNKKEVRFFAHPIVWTDTK
jgi:hypothetical protein